MIKNEIDIKLRFYFSNVKDMTFLQISYGISDTMLRDFRAIRIAYKGFNVG